MPKKSGRAKKPRLNLTNLESANTEDQNRRLITIAALLGLEPSSQINPENFQIDAETENGLIVILAKPNGEDIAIKPMPNSRVNGHIAAIA